MSKKFGGDFEDTIILCLSVLGIIFAFPFFLHYLGKILYDDEYMGGFCTGLFVWNVVLLSLTQDCSDYLVLGLSVFCIVAWILICIIQFKYDLPILTGCYVWGIFCICLDVGVIVGSICSIMRTATIMSILML